MPGNTYDKYKLSRQVRGKENLQDPTAEAVVHLSAKGSVPEDIVIVFANAGKTITLEQIEDILAQPLAQKRLKYKQTIQEHHTPRPTTPDAIWDFAIRGLVKMARLGETEKVKVDALRVLATVSRGQASAPIQVSSEDDDILKTLNK